MSCSRLTQGSLKQKLNQVFGALTTYVIDVIDAVTYVALVAYWRFVWDLFDVVAYHEIFADHLYLVIFIAHFVTYMIYVAMGLTENIYGGDGNPEENEHIMQQQKSATYEPEFGASMDKI